MSAEPVRVRPGTALDAAQVAELLNRIIRDRDGTALTMPVSLEAETEFLAELLQDGFLLLAMQKKRLLGFQSVNRIGREVGEIGTFVEREARGQGVGCLLLEGVCEWAARQNIFTLIAEVAVGNAAGLRAYRAWGFVADSADAEKVRLNLNLD